MLEAKSMYLGGDIVAAQECDYGSYSRLGLKCPFCDSAVFIRSASVRKIKGVEKPIGAYFAHFPSGYTDNWDCEARSQSKAGREEIERIKIEARGQRLKIYNSHLWKLIATDRNISRQRIASTRKLMDGRWIDNWTKLVRRELSQSLEDLYQHIDIAIDMVNKASVEDVQDIVSKDYALEQIAVQKAYFCDCDRRLHQSICYEVIEFLGTNSGGWALNRLVTIATELVGRSMGSNTAAAVKESSQPAQYAVMISHFLVGVHWAEIIDRFT
jgi:hypothetical protein